MDAPPPLNPDCRPLPARLVIAYFGSGTSNYAAGLAFNLFLSIFPIVLGLFAILGLVLHDRAAYQAVEQVVVQAFPEEARASIVKTLQDARTNAGAIAMLSVVGLVYAGTGLFGSLEFALNQIYGVRGRNPIRQRIAGLQLIGVFAIAIILATVINGAIGLVHGQLTNAAAYLNVLASWLVITYLLWFIYRFVPNARVRAAAALPGAAAAGALIEALSLAFPPVYEQTHRASTYTRGFALVLVLATWLYLISQLVLMGALLNRLLTDGTSGGPISRQAVPGQEEGPVPLLEEREAAGIKIG